MGLISRSDWCFTKTDKDAGFAASRTEVLADCLEDTLFDETKYSIVSNSHITIDLVDEYKRVYYVVVEREASEVGLDNSQKRRFINSLCSDIHWRHVDTVPAQVLFTAKTHKPQHEMKPRNVHGSQRGPFVPMKRYICNKIQKRLSKLKHLNSS